MSTTAQSSRPERSAAPRIEFVGPEAKVATGYLSAKSTLISVPSFWLRYTGASIPSSASAERNAATMCSARSRRHAFITVAFSRSSRPMRPIS